MSRTHATDGTPSSADTAVVHRLQQILKRGPDDTAKVMAVTQLHRQIRYHATETEIRQVYQAGVALAEALHFRKGVGGLMLSQVGYLRVNKGDYPAALALAVKAVPVLEEAQDESSLGYNYILIGILHIEMNQPVTGLEWYIRGSEILDQRPTLPLSGYGYYVVGRFYRDQGNFHLADRYYRKSMDLFRGNPARSELGYLDAWFDFAANLVFIDAAKGRVELLKLKEKVDGDPALAPIVSGILTMIGQSYFGEGNYRESIGWYRQAMEQALQFTNAYAPPDAVYVKYARALIQLDSMDKAEVYLQAAQRSTRKTTILGYQDFGVALKLRAEIARRRGNYREALRHQTNYVHLMDSVHAARNILTSLDMESHFEKLEQEKQRKNAEMRLRHQQAENQVLLGSGALIFMLGGVTLMVVFQSRAKVRKKNKLLNWQNREIQKDKRELALANAKLNELILIRNRLLSVVTHDIRGPLVALRNLGTVKRFASPDELRQVEDHIFRSVETTIDLLDNITRWSSAQLVERNEVLLSKVNVNHVVEDVFQIYRLTAEQKGLSLQLDMDNAKDAELVTDGALLHLVLRNLVSNGIKFTREGFVRIRCVSTTEGLRIEVIDSGMGISPGMIDAILAGRVVGSKTLGTAQEKGSGVGLVLCQTFLDKLKTRLQYERVGHPPGSRFFFMLRDATAMNGTGVTA